MSALIVRSMVVPDSSSNLRVPSVGVYPRSRCSCASASKLSVISPNAWRAVPMPSRCTASIEAMIVSRLLEASSWPARNAAASSSEGCATKSLEAICIRAKAALNSRLASASTAALLTLAKAFPTSVSPLVNARPLARKPTTGMTAMAAMRLRTESLEMSCWKEKLGNIGNRMAGIDPAMAIMPSGWPRVWPLEQYQG